MNDLKGCVFNGETFKELYGPKEYIVILNETSEFMKKMAVTLTSLMSAG